MLKQKEQWERMNYWQSCPTLRQCSISSGSSLVFAASEPHMRHK